MKRATNILVSSILLILTLMGTEGVSVERCSCTGNISLAKPALGDCCPGEGGCMSVYTLQLADYLPSDMASIEMPPQPLLISITTHLTPIATSSHWLRELLIATPPPRAMAETVAVLRV